MSYPEIIEFIIFKFVLQVKKKDFTRNFIGNKCNGIQTNEQNEHNKTNKTNTTQQNKTKKYTFFGTG